MKGVLFLLPYTSVYKISELSDVVTNITDTISWVIATLLVLVIVGFGVQFLLNAESPQERMKLRSKIIWSLIGLFIILAARPISSWLQSIL